MADVTLQGSLRIKEIEVRSRGGRADLRFPTYVSARGRVYPQVRCLTRQARDRIGAAVQSGVSSGTVTGPLTYALRGWRTIDGSAKMRAVGLVVFNEAVAVECKVVETARGKWVVWPARRPQGGGKWIDQVVLLDKRLKDAIAVDILLWYDTAGSADKRSAI